MNRSEFAPEFLATVRMLKAIVWVAAATALAGANALASPIVTVAYHGAAATASTASSAWEYVPSGGGRGSHGYHWVPVSVQDISVSDPVGLNQTVGPLNAIGTHFAPHYWSTARCGNTWVDTSTLAVFTVQQKVWTVLNTPVVADEWISEASQTYDEFFFTLANPEHINLTATTTAGVGVTLTDISTGDVFTVGSGKFDSDMGPGEYELRGSIADSAEQDTFTPYHYNLGAVSYILNYTLTVSAPTGGGSGGSGDS